MPPEIVIERWDRDTSNLEWEPVVRFFVGGPLDGRALEGADSREWEAGPMAATADYFHDGWILYVPAGGRGGVRVSLGNGESRAWIVYILAGEDLLRRARARYIDSRIDLVEFEQAVDWALAVE